MSPRRPDGKKAMSSTERGKKMRENKRSYSVHIPYELDNKIADFKGKSSFNEYINKLLNPLSNNFYSKYFGKNFDGGLFILELFPRYFKYTMALLVKNTFSWEELSLMIETVKENAKDHDLQKLDFKDEVLSKITYQNLDKKYKVNGQELFEKLEELGFFEKLCLEIWVMAYWLDTGVSDYPEYDNIKIID